MRRLLTLLFAILLISTVSAVSYKEISKIGDFTKIKVNEKEAYILDNIKESEQLVAVDKIFYGSSQGSATIKIYLSDNSKISNGKYKIGLKTKSKDIIVKRVKIDTNDAQTKNPKATKDFIYSTSFDLDSDLHEIEIELEFNPETIGFSEKFDIILYDNKGNIILVLDPFLSGYDERYAINPSASNPEILNTHTFSIDNIDSTAFNCTDNNMLAVGYHNGAVITSLDRRIFGTCGSTDINVHFKSQFNIPASASFESSDTNGYYLYSKSTAESSPEVDLSNVYPIFYDDFATGNIATGEESWTVSQGTWAESDGRLKSSDTGELYAEISGVASETIIEMGVTINGEANFNTRAPIISDSTGSGDGDDYYLQSSDAGGTYELIKRNGGSRSVLDTDSFNFSASTDYITRVRRDSSNKWTGAINTTGYIDVSDSDHNTFQYVIMRQDSEVNLYYDDVYVMIPVLDSTIGAKEEPLNDYNVIFNVFQGTGIQNDLNNINIDFNVDAYDQTSVNSPVTINDVNTGHYLVTISKDNWSDTNTFTLIVDSNQNLTKTIDNFTYPFIAQFEVDGETSTNSNAYQTISTFEYSTAYGSSTSSDVSCSLWASSNNTSTRSAFWRIQTSDNGVDWTTRKETERTLTENTVADNIYIGTTDFNISDGTHFFRLQHRRQNGVSFTLNSNNVVCHSFIARDQNNNLIQDLGDSQTALSTSSASYVNLNSGALNTENFNGFYYYYGDMIYDQSVTTGKSYIKGDLQDVPDSNSAEYIRTTTAGNIGIGGFHGFFNDLNADSSYNVQTYGKTSAGTIDFSYELQMKYLNQKAGEFDQNKSLNATFSNTGYETIVQLQGEQTTTADYRVLAVLSFSCSEDETLVETILNIKNGSYDVNSTIIKNSIRTAGITGIIVNQFLFNDVNSLDFNVNLLMKTDKGTVTLEGGSLSFIKMNETNTQTTNAPQNPLVYAPVSGSTVSGASVDYNCFTTDPDLDPLTYDVNVIVKDTNALAINLESAGTGNGTFDSTSLADGNYNIQCSVNDGNFTVKFDNQNYYFYSSNDITPVQPPNSISNLCEIESKVVEREGIYYFNSDIIDSNGFKTGLNPKISFYSQKYDLTVFSNKSMQEELTGNYVYSKDMFLENGQYSYLINVDANCYKTFALEITDSFDVVSFGSMLPKPKAINTTSGFDIWGFIEDITKITGLGFFVIILILVAVYIEKK